MIEYDGKIWDKMPDFGSFRSVKIEKNNIHRYVGLHKDISKLPTYCGTGSTAHCADNGDVYTFIEENKQWYKSGDTLVAGIQQSVIPDNNNNNESSSNTIEGEISVEGDSLVITK